MPVDGITCPYCKRADGVFIGTPDYGYGYGTEFGCYCGGRRNTWTDKTEVGKRASAASFAASSANARKYWSETHNGEPVPESLDGMLSDRVNK